MPVCRLVAGILPATKLQDQVGSSFRMGLSAWDFDIASGYDGCLDEAWTYMLCWVLVIRENRQDTSKYNKYLIAQV